jgi:hypothetical protein
MLMKAIQENEAAEGRKKTAGSLPGFGVNTGNQSGVEINSEELNQARAGKEAGLAISRPILYPIKRVGD